MNEQASSDIFTGKIAGPQSGQETKQKEIPPSGSVTDFTPKDGPQTGDPARSDQHREIGEEQHPPATLGSAPVIQTDFKEFEDGRLIEMIEHPNDPASSLFAVHEGGVISYAASVQCKNQIFVPLPRQDEMLKHMRFPQAVTPHKSLAELHGALVSVLVHCLDIEIYAHLVSFFVLSTYFLERLSVAPYLCVVGPPESGKTTLLTLLNQLCRHPLLTADVTSASLYDVYDRLTPTLLIDETLTIADNRALFHFLRAGFTRGSTILRKGRSVDPFGPKVISCTEIPDDRALVSRCIIIPMMQSNRANLKKLSDEWVTRATQGLRMALLDYRLRNLKSLSVPKTDGEERLSPRSRDLYQALALPVGSNELFCKFLVSHLKHEQEVKREPLSAAATTTLRSLEFVIHAHPDAAKYAYKVLMMTANLMPESLRLTAHEIGDALTELGFTDRKRTNAGYVVWLDLRARKRIHKLAHDHGIDQEAWFKEGGFAANCLLCKESAEANRDSAESKGEFETKPGQK
jgi:energy-coupling factor transporter ATP-binding protein EcfA2